jgi:tetratricopeptide (TPR) repeat protein
MNIIQLLKQAEEEFISKNYKKALLEYSLVLQQAPNNQDAKVGVFLCDLASSNTQEAQALFEYYYAIKDETPDALEVIETLIDSLESTQIKLHQILTEPLKEELDYSDGIRYEDFIKLVEDRGSFKKAFEDIMFSTKVVITDKEEFIDFVTNLAKEGFSEMALNYLDATSSLFGNDQDVLELYNVLKGKKNEHQI